MSEVLTEARRKQLLESYFRTRPETVSEPANGLRRRAPDARIPLTFAQKQLWLHAQLAPNSALYNEPLTVRHHGPLDTVAMERALNEIVRRHEAWRTTFPQVDGEPEQHVQPAVEVKLQEIDLGDLAPERREPEAVRIASEDARLPFDIEHGPLFRAKLVRLSDTEQRLYLTLHHLIFDGFGGYRVFLPELATLYQSYLHGESSPLSEPPFQFGDYAIWQQGKKADAADSSDLTYWREQLHGPLPALDLPDRKTSSSAVTQRGAVIRAARSCWDIF
jgi:hypothetical protein